MRQDTTQHFEMIKKIINSIAKKINFSYGFKSWLLFQTMGAYVITSGKGLAYHIYKTLSSNTSISLPPNIHTIIVNTIKAYDKNNPYEQFQKHINGIAYMRAFKQRGQYASLEEAFCCASIAKIIDDTLWWDETEEGFDYWEEQNQNWRDFISKQLNTPAWQSMLREIKQEYLEKLLPSN